MFKLIGECSVLPMSVIIIGIGDEDFSSMHKLDNLEEIKKHISDENVKQKLRQITQFIAFHEVGNDVEQLTQSVLHTLTQQFMEYVKLNGLEPKKGTKIALSQVK